MSVDTMSAKEVENFLIMQNWKNRTSDDNYNRAYEIVQKIKGENFDAFREEWGIKEKHFVK